MKIVSNSKCYLINYWGELLTRTRQMAAQMSSNMASNRRPFLRVGKYSKPDSSMTSNMASNRRSSRRVGKYSKPDSSIDDPDPASASPAVIPEQARNS